MKKRSATLALALALLAVDAQAGLEDGLAAFQRKDWPNALKELQPLAQNGDTVAQSRLGHMILNGNGTARDVTEALRLLTLAADKGDSLAQNTLGGVYFRGNGVPRDIARALVLFSRAADQNQPNALNNLGQLYFTGNGVVKDEAKAMDYLRRAADAGISASWETLGIAYWHGRGVAQDKAKALPWLKKAAERGHQVAQNLYGAALWSGDGIAADRAEAVKWFERSGNQGDAASLLNAGHAYFNGMGVTRDPETGYYYYILAERQAKPADKAKFGETKAKARLSVTPDQERQAEDRAAKWVAKAQGPEDGAAPADKGMTANGSAPPPRPQRNTGSGIVVSPNGEVLTNSHVVKGCRTIRVSLGDSGAPLAASVIARDDINDMALLNTTGKTGDFARFRDGSAMRSGDNVVAIGFPLSSLLSREPNITAGVISAQNGLRGDKRHYQVTAPIQRGNSGGPLTDMNGNVVGIVVSTLNASKLADSTGAIPQNVNFAIKAELARKFLTDSNVTVSTAAPSAPLSAADVGDIARKFAAYVECEG